MAVNATSRAALVMLDLANSLNHQKTPQSSLRPADAWTQSRGPSTGTLIWKVFHGWQIVFGEKRSQAFESSRSARSDSLWWLWNIQVKKICVKSQTAVQSQLAAEASYETNARHLLQINLSDEPFTDSQRCLCFLTVF